MYTQEYDVLDDNEGIGIPEVYANATSTGTEYEKRPIAAREFTQETTKQVVL